MINYVNALADESLIYSLEHLSIDLSSNSLSSSLLSEELKYDFLTNL